MKTTKIKDTYLTLHKNKTLVFTWSGNGRQHKQIDAIFSDRQTKTIYSTIKDSYIESDHREIQTIMEWKTPGIKETNHIFHRHKIPENPPKETLIKYNDNIEKQDDGYAIQIHHTPQSTFNHH